jgi:hypothetical protein
MVALFLLKDELIGSMFLLTAVEWWRAYYHFVRPHEALRIALMQPRERGGNRQNHPTMDGSRGAFLPIVAGFRLRATEARWGCIVMLRASR